MNPYQQQLSLLESSGTLKKMIPLRSSSPENIVVFGSNHIVESVSLLARRQGHHVFHLGVGSAGVEETTLAPLQLDEYDDYDTLDVAQRGSDFRLPKEVDVCIQGFDSMLESRPKLEESFMLSMFERLKPGGNSYHFHDYRWHADQQGSISALQYLKIFNLASVNRNLYYSGSRKVNEEARRAAAIFGGSVYSPGVKIESKEMILEPVTCACIGLNSLPMNKSVTSKDINHKYVKPVIGSAVDLFSVQKSS